MESCLSYIYPHTRVHSIVGILKTTAHNAFPVVTIDKTTRQDSHGDNFVDNVDSSNEQFARTTTLSSLTSEQKLRRTLMSGAENSLLHRLRSGSEHHPASHRISIKGKRLPSDGDQDSLLVSSSAPMASNLVTNYLGHEGVMADDNDGKCAMQDSHRNYGSNKALHTYFVCKYKQLSVFTFQYIVSPGTLNHFPMSFQGFVFHGNKELC